MIERLPAAGSILELAMPRFVLGKDTLRLFLIRAKQSIRCGGPDLHTEPKGCSALVCMVRQLAQRGWFMRANERQKSMVFEKTNFLALLYFLTPKKLEKLIAGTELENCIN